MNAVQGIIVAHDAGELLLPSVESLLRDLDQDDVIVVDNASTDGSVVALSGLYRHVRVIASDNRGFAAGNNIGIAAADAPWLLLLNPDAELAPGSLDELLFYGSTHPSAGIIGPEVLDPDGKPQEGSRGRFPSFCEVVRSHLPWNTIHDGRSSGSCSIAEPTSVPWLTGACMLVRREAIREVGSLDEGFFLYYEDVDWCHRMHDAGWDVVVVPRARVIHHRGRAASPAGLVARAYRESFYRYCRKYDLWALSLCSRIGLWARHALGGRL